MKYLVITVCMLTFCTVGFSQSINKVYKFIKKGKIEEAYVELKEYQKTYSKKGKDIAIGTIAEVLILSNKESTRYNPFEAIDLARKDKIIIERYKSEVDIYLKKLQMNYSSLEDSLLDEMYQDVLLKDDELVYYKAKQYCGSCKYKDSLDHFLELNVYNSAKTKRTIEECERFLFVFPSSSKAEEITNLRDEIAFLKLSESPSVEGANQYLQKYPQSIFVESVIEIRDYLEFSSLEKSYANYVKFRAKYPNSKMNALIEEKLPDLLYSEAIRKNKIDYYLKFLKEFSDDARVTEIQEKLELAYYNEIKSSSSKVLLKEFISKFPNSKFKDELNRVVESKAATNDWDKYHLEGMVKKIVVKSAGDDGTGWGGKKIKPFSETTFNEFGNIERVHVIEGSIIDDVEGFEYSTTPKEFKFENLYVDLYGYYRSTIRLDGHPAGMGLHHQLNLFTYDSNHNLIRIQQYCDQTNEWSGNDEVLCKEILFDYDYNNNLIKKSINLKELSQRSQGLLSNFITPNPGTQKLVEYSWSGKELIEKKVYALKSPYTNSREDSWNRDFKYLYKVENSNSQQTIYEYSESDANKIKRKLIIVFDSQGKVTSKTIYNYSNDFLYKKEIKEYDYNGIKLSKVKKTITEYERRFGEVHETISHETISIERDNHENIVQVNSKNNYDIITIELKVNYKYDSQGNWIEKNYLNPENNSVEETIFRDITYY